MVAPIQAPSRQQASTSNSWALQVQGAVATRGTQAHAHSNFSLIEQQYRKRCAAKATRLAKREFDTVVGGQEVLIRQCAWLAHVLTTTITMSENARLAGPLTNGVGTQEQG